MTDPLPYFPFPDDYYAMRMDARAGVESLIEMEAEKYATQIALKQEILAPNPRYYFQCPPDAEPLAWETLEIILPNMARALPQFFSLERTESRWTWTNKLLGETTAFTLGDSNTLPRPPLDWLGRQIQEDVILLAAKEDGETVCKAGHLCFAAGWCLDDKIGKTFLAVHDDVPHFRDTIGTPADLLMRRLKAHRPVARINWTISSTGQLNRAPLLAHEWLPTREGITKENAGERCFLRIERQTLSRLPRTGGILFTIHTYIHPIAHVAADPSRARRLAAVPRGMPAATREYKGMTSYADALIAYLEAV